MAYDVLLIRKVVNFFTKASDQRERIAVYRAKARIGWRLCRQSVPQLKEASQRVQ